MLNMIVIDGNEVIVHISVQEFVLGLTNGWDNRLGTTE